MHWLFSCFNHCLLFSVFLAAVSIMRHSASAFGFAVGSAVKTSLRKIYSGQREKQYWPCDFSLFNSVVWRHAGCVVFRHRAVAVQQRSRGPLSAPRVHVSTLFTLHASLLCIQMHVSFSSVCTDEACVSFCKMQATTICLIGNDITAIVVVLERCYDTHFWIFYCGLQWSSPPWLKLYKSP